MTIEVVDELEARRRREQIQGIRELAEAAIKFVDWIRADPKRTAAALGIAALLGSVLTADSSAKRR